MVCATRYRKILNTIYLTAIDTYFICRYIFWQEILTKIDLFFSGVKKVEKFLLLIFYPNFLTQKGYLQLSFFDNCNERKSPDYSTFQVKISNEIEKKPLGIMTPNSKFLEKNHIVCIFFFIKMHCISYLDMCQLTFLNFKKCLFQHKVDILSRIFTVCSILQVCSTKIVQFIYY